MSSMIGSVGPTGYTGNKVPSGYKTGQLQQFTPEQYELFRNMFQYAQPGSYLSKLAGGGDEEMFKKIEGPAIRQFSQLQGDIASRFSQPGLGSRKSSGFQNTMSQSASDFAQQLQSQRQSLQQQAIQELMGLSGSLLGEKPYEQFMVKKQNKSSGLGGILGAALGGVGGFFLGGPGGAMTGSQLGYNVGSAF